MPDEPALLNTVLPERRVPDAVLAFERLQSDPVFFSETPAKKSGQTPRKVLKKDLAGGSKWAELLGEMDAATQTVSVRSDSFTIQFECGILATAEGDTPTLTLLLHGDQGTMLTPRPETSFEVHTHDTVYTVLYLGGSVRLGLRTQLLTFIVEAVRPLYSVG